MQASANPYDLKLNIYNQNGNPSAATRWNRPLEPDIENEQDFENDTKNNDKIKNILNQTFEEIIKNVKSAKLIGEIVDTEFKVPNKPAKSTLGRKKRDEQRAFYESEECMDNIVFSVCRYSDSIIKWSKARNVHKRYRDGYLATQEVDTEELDLKRQTKQLKVRKAFHKAKKDMVRNGCVRSIGSSSCNPSAAASTSVFASSVSQQENKSSNSTPVLKLSSLNIEDGDISDYDDDAVAEISLPVKVESKDVDGDAGMKQ